MESGTVGMQTVAHMGTLRMQGEDSAPDAVNVFYITNKYTARHFLIGSENLHTYHVLCILACFVLFHFFHCFVFCSPQEAVQIF